MNFAFLLQQNTLTIITLIVVSIAVVFNIFLPLLSFLNHKNGFGLDNRFLMGLQRHWIALELGIFILLLAVALPIVTLSPKVTDPSGPTLKAVELSRSKPLEIKFNHPVNKKSLKFLISPDLEGEWKISSGIFKNESNVTFIPRITPEADTIYTVSIQGIKNLLGRKENDFLFSFETLPASTVEKLSINDGDQGILPNQEIDINITNPDSLSAEFSFELLPSIEITSEKTKEGYQLRANNNWQKGTEYNLKIFRTLISTNYETGEKIKEGEKQELKSIKFRTVDSTGVAKTSPSGSLVPSNSEIAVEFRQDMDSASTEAAFSLSPAVAGSFSWQAKRILTFKPSQNLAKNTKYKVTISKDAKVADGSNLDEATAFEFTTIGYVLISRTTPGNGASGVDRNISISILFNQAVDHASAEAKFSISPAVTGNYQWKDSTMTFAHSGLAYNQKYTVTLSSGIKSINGLDSKENYSFSFSTKQQNVSLNVPAYKQGHFYSCMASAARSALAFKGTAVSEDTLLSLMGYDDTAWSGNWNDPNAENVWGDPDSGIVGDVNGKKAPGWGYGAHWGPTARAISKYRQAEVKNGWNVSSLAQSIADGNPVLVWWVNGVWPAFEVRWHTPSGKNIRGVNSMHVQVVKGFSGTVENPASFTVTDSGYGYPGKTIDIQTFKAKWNWFGNSAVVVK